MSQDTAIMSAAYRQFLADKERRQARQERRRQELYRRQPRLELLDRELSATAARLVAAAFGENGNPEAALRELEQGNLALQAQRTALLAAMGCPPEALDSRPECPLCGDSGYLRDGTPCRCLLAYYTQEQNRRLSKLLDLGGQSFESFSLDWYSREVWPQYARSPRENMEMVREICVEYAASFGAQTGNLLFTGAPGLGKTFLSACIAREVSGRGFSVVYDTAAHIFQQFEREKFGRESPYEEDPDREIDRCLHCDLLIMDDLGTEMLTSFVQSAFYRIVNDRLAGRRKTVLSTNLAAEDLAPRYGEGAASRVRGEYQVLRFFGEDIRLLRRDR